MTIAEKIDLFLSADAFGVVGASKNRDKYGNKVLRCYIQNQRAVMPVNPLEDEIEGMECFDSVSDLPQKVTSLSIITPPEVTEEIVVGAIAKGIQNIWMQPGAESPRAIQNCQEAGINIIADGSCILVVMGYREH